MMTSMSMADRRWENRTANWLRVETFPLTFFLKVVRLSKSHKTHKRPSQIFNEQKSWKETENFVCCSHKTSLEHVSFFFVASRRVSESDSVVTRRVSYFFLLTPSPSLFALFIMVTCHRACHITHENLVCWISECVRCEMFNFSHIKASQSTHPGVIRLKDW